MYSIIKNYIPILKALAEVVISVHPVKGFRQLYVVSRHHEHTVPAVEILQHSLGRCNALRGIGALQYLINGEEYEPAALSLLNHTFQVLYLADIVALPCEQVVPDRHRGDNTAARHRGMVRSAGADGLGKDKIYRRCLDESGLSRSIGACDDSVALKSEIVGNRIVQHGMKDLYKLKAAFVIYLGNAEMRQALSEGANGYGAVYAAQIAVHLHILVLFVSQLRSAHII